MKCLRLINPAACVVRLFGGVRRCAKAIGRTPGAVSQWRRKGTVPVDVQQIVLLKSKAGEVKIDAEELILGSDS